jgi:hypothetical protein
MGIVGRLDQYASMLAGEFDDYSMSENLFLYSEQYNQTSWINQNSFETVNTTATLSPDGFYTAEKLIGNNGQANRQSIYQTVSVTSGTTYTFSVFLKQAERRYATIWFDALSITEGAYYGASTYIDLQTGTIATGTQSRIVAYPNGWYRVYVTATPSFTGSLNLNLAIGTPNNAADGAGSIAYQYTGDGVSGFYIWGGQFERGTGPTDYTPTTTAAITRVLSSTTNTNITGLSTYFSSGFSENVGAATTLVANVFPPYDLVYDDFGGTLFGSGQGRYMRQNTDKSVIVYNEIDEVSDFYSRGVVRAGLVLDLDAGVPSSYPGTGTTWTDLSPYGNNGTLTLGPTYSSANGGSIVFDGSNDYVLGTITGSIFTGSFTQSAWIYKLNNNQIWQGVFTNSSPATSNTYLMTFGNGSLQAPYNSVGVNQVGIVPDGVFLDIGTHINKWLYIIITKVGSTLNIYCYKDGSLLQTSGTITWNSGNFATTNNYEIGRHWAGGSVVPLQGNVAQVSVYNRALTAAEIKQNYDATKGRFGL